MENAILIWMILVIPAVSSALCLLLRSLKFIRLLIYGSVLSVMLVALVAARIVLAQGQIMAVYGWFFLDALSAYHLVILQIIFTLSSIYAGFYFAAEIQARTFELRLLPRYGFLWLGSQTAMNLVMVSNNLGIMWVGIEATTLLTAFLICIHFSSRSLEAMWKYLIMCSVGVAFAFIGTLFVGASCSKLEIEKSQTLLWTRLYHVASQLDPFLLKMGFIFLVIGYGTKVGLAPMHSWLPDAHSQAPAPVSAIFSGFLLNTAFYCIMRYIPLVEIATGYSRWSLDILVFLGIFSILVSGVFILFQHDAKRLLAYHSVEHMGIIAVGLGLGGIGTFGAIFHVLNHSICKALSFFAAGSLGQLYGTHDLGKIKGVFHASPIWGIGLFMSILVLIGMAPFAIFMSEFQILKAAVDKNAHGVLALFLLGGIIVFIGALRHVIPIGWGEASVEQKPEKAGLGEFMLVLCPLFTLLFLGLWMPDFLKNAIEQAANIIRG